MLVSIVLDELERRSDKRAMISLCVGGGMGVDGVNEFKDFVDKLKGLNFSFCL